MQENYLLVDLCKCKYCGSHVLSLNDIAQCPKGCSGNMRVVQSTLFKNKNDKIKFVGNYLPDGDYDQMREDIK